MKLTKKQFTKLIEEVTNEVLNENLAKACPNKMSETISEAASDDAKKFALEIVEKIKDRRRKKGYGDMNIAEAIRQMIEFKLNKEGWVKGSVSVPPSAGIGKQKPIGEGSKLFNVSLDRPGAGWSEQVKANSPEEAKKIANKFHESEPPADTVWEIPQSGKMLGNRESVNEESNYNIQESKKEMKKLELFGQSILEKIKKYDT
jgi:hypothetical protein